MQPLAAISMFLATQLIHLQPVDILILVYIFAVVIFIGFYTRESTNTSERVLFSLDERCQPGSQALSFVSQPRLAWS